MHSCYDSSFCDKCTTTPQDSPLEIITKQDPKYALAVEQARSIGGLTEQNYFIARQHDEQSDRVARLETENRELRDSRNYWEREANRSEMALVEAERKLTRLKPKKAKKAVKATKKGKK